MKKVNALLLLLFLVNILHAQEVKIDFSDKYSFDSARQFIEMAKRAKKGELPTEENWNQLYQTEGYRLFLTNSLADFFRKEIKNAFYLNFDENRKSELQDSLSVSLEADDYMSTYHLLFIHNYDKLNSNLDKAALFLDTLDIENLLSRSLKETKKFIPESDRIINQDQLNNCYFICREPEASVRNNAVFIDLTYCIDLKYEELLKLFAHEYHHNFRDVRRKTSYNDPLLYVLEKMNTEGVADLIDKEIPDRSTLAHSGLSATDSFKKEFAKEFYNTPNRLKEIDDIVTKKYIQDKDTVAYKKLFRLVSMGGHPNGFYMANLIKKELGLESVVNVYADPVGFFRLYNTAATKAGKDEYVLSNDFILYINKFD